MACFHLIALVICTKLEASLSRQNPFLTRWCRAAGMAVFDTMRYVKADVSTVCVGLAASMGAFLLASGHQVGAAETHRPISAECWHPCNVSASLGPLGGCLLMLRTGSTDLPPCSVVQTKTATGWTQIEYMRFHSTWPASAASTAPAASTTQYHSSKAMHVLQGKRYSLPNSRIMIHQPLGGAQGQAADIEIQANEILHHKLTLNGYLAEFTGQGMERITQDTGQQLLPCHLLVCLGLQAWLPSTHLSS